MAELPTARGDHHAHTRAAIARPSSAASILDLARGAAAGDERDISEFYERRFRLVFNAARAATGRDEHFCLDAVQESFLRILRAGPALARLQDDAHVDRWLIRVAQSAALDLLRAERRRAARERLAIKPGKVADPGASIERLEALLAGLPADERELLRLRSSGLTLAAIAEIIGISIGSVHGRLRRLTAAMRRSQKEHDHD